MDRQQRIAGMVFLLIGVLGAWGGYAVGLWKYGRPWAGLWPFLISLVIIALSIVVWSMNRQTASDNGDHASDDAQDGPVDRTGSKDLVVTIIGSVLFGLFAKQLGFVFGGFLLMLLLFRTVNNERWSLSLSVSAGAVIVFYLLFSVVLGIPLPKGILAWVSGL